jgi:hypothetical protein
MKSRVFVLASRLLAIAVVVCASSSGSPTTARAAAPDPALVQARANRASLGLAADPTTVARLVGSRNDVGTAEWGIPMSAKEVAEVDLVGRGRFANDIATRILPSLEKRADFAGVWIEPTGNAVVGLTSDDPSVAKAVSAFASDTRWSVRLERRERSLAALEDAATRLWKLWDESAAGRLSAVRVHVQDGSLIAEVDESHLESASQGAAALSESLGVPLALVASEPDLDTTCTSRNNCYDPFKAGIVIRNGSSTSSGTCTMAFHLDGGEYAEQFITAGHCGAAYSSTKWYHQGGSTYVGGELATLLTNNGIDAMRINIATNSYADNHLYGNRFIQSSISWRNPISGEMLCANLGVSEAIKCGSVTDASISWTSSTTGDTVTGADLAVTTIVGDSGSPIHTPGSSGDYVWAVGISDTAGAHFARMGSIMAKPAFDGLTLVYGQS